jgi:Ca2+-binding RTX toxin-like protein
MKTTTLIRPNHAWQTVAVLAAIMVMVLLAGGLAYAAVITKVCDTPTCEGDNGPNNLIGTQINNTIYGYGRADTITDTARIDKDVIYAGRGGDVINVKEGTDNPHDADYVRCSAGYDTVYYDSGVDAVVGCELKNPVSP